MYKLSQNLLPRLLFKVASSVTFFLHFLIIHFCPHFRGFAHCVRITLTQNSLRPRNKWQRSQSGRIFITAMIAQLSLSLLPLLGLKKRPLFEVRLVIFGYVIVLCQLKTVYRLIIYVFLQIS